MNDLFAGMAARVRGESMASEDGRQPGESGSTIAADSGETRESGGGNVAPGYADRVSTCPIWCGAAIDGVVNYCCPSCREICEGFAE